MDTLRLHATCIALKSSGVLLMGESGMGKSDLALRLLDRGAKLVADDQVELLRVKNHLIATSPQRIQGLLEVRGVGIFKVRFMAKVKLALIIHLSKQEWIERLPYPEPYECLGVEVPQLRLCAFEAAAALKIEMAVAALKNDSMTVGALKE